MIWPNAADPLVLAHRLQHPIARLVAFSFLGQHVRLVHQAREQIQDVDSPDAL